MKIDEWMTPSKPAYPHDPAVAPDGSIWYTAQRANTIGRFDPATEQFKEFALPTPNSGPHGLQADKDGNIWYTGNAAGLIGKIDPKTGKVTEYKMPNPKAKDPHTIAFLQDGRLFFTVQAGQLHRHARSEGADGNIKLVESPTVNSRPVRRPPRLEGRARTSTSSTRTRSRSADPKTLIITRVPAAGPRTRGRAASPSARTTRCGTATTRAASSATSIRRRARSRSSQSPGGAESKPYAIDVTADGAIWYVETGDETKNMLVRFNPETKKFLTWPIPSGGGTVRNMEIDKNGNLWLA